MDKEKEFRLTSIMTNLASITLALGFGLITLGYIGGSESGANFGGGILLIAGILSGLAIGLNIRWFFKKG
jgi:hypothetical protein